MTNKRTGVAMKQVLMAAALTTMCVNGAAAAEYGIGVSAKSDDAWIYIPIDITPRIRLEPSIRFTSTKSESTSSSSGLYYTTETTYRSKSDQQEIGLGVFGLTALADSVRLYYGLRTAYIDGDFKSTIMYSSTFVDTEEEKLSQDGYRLSPTLGFEYALNKHFSIGGEAEWFYLDVDGERTSTDSYSLSEPKTEFKQKSNGTATHLIVRYRF